jgi:hypothetical protein
MPESFEFLEQVVKDPTTAEETFATKTTEEQEKRRSGVLVWSRRILLTAVAVAAVILIIINRSAFVNLFLLIFTPKKPEAEVVQEVVVTDKRLLTGELTPIWDDLGYLNKNNFSEIKYYQAGIYRQGQYQGAKRIVAVAKRNTETLPETFIFLVTTDGKIFFDGGAPAYDTLVKNLQAYYVWRDITAEKNIVFVDNLVNDHATTLEVSPVFALYRRTILTGAGIYALTGKTGDGILLGNLETAGYEKLGSIDKYPDLTFWAKPYDAAELDVQIDPRLSVEEVAKVGEYLASGSEVVVTDSTGLAYVYDLTFKNKVTDFAPKLAEMMILVNDYKMEVQQYALASGSGEPAVFGWWLDYPGLTFAKNEFYFRAGNTQVTFDDYGVPFESTCSGLLDAKVLKNVTGEELENVGVIDIPQTTLYRLKDDNAPLSTAMYDWKIGSSGLSEEVLTKENQDLFVLLAKYNEAQRRRVAEGRERAPLPSREQYVGGLPLLIFQDAWGRYLLIGEQSVTSGC